MNRTYIQHYKSLFTLGIPIVIGQVGVIILGFADTLMIGHHSTNELAAASFVNNMFTLAIIFATGFSYGLTPIVGSLFGRGETSVVGRMLKNSIFANVLLAVLLTFIMWVLYLNIHRLGQPEELLPLMRPYFIVLLISLLFVLLFNAFKQFADGITDTRVSMWLLLGGNVMNIIGNYILIYGKFGFPELGVVGAAVATVLSRYVEMAIVLVWTHKHKEINTYIVGLYKTMKIPGYLIKKFIIKGSPLLFNETLWAAAQATLMQCYSVRGLSVVAAFNIANTIANLFNVVFIALGDSVAIVVGQRLGAGKMDEARDLDNKMIAFSVMCCTGVAIVMFLIAPLFPQLYNTDSTTRHLAEYLIMTQAVFMPQNAFLHATYFTLRSGGKTVVTFFFDSVFVWIVSVPIAFVLSRFTGLFVVVIFACVNIADWIKCVIGFVLVKKGVWLQNIVSQKE